jgi:hypothetical protein
VKADFELPVPDYKAWALTKRKRKHWQPQFKGHTMMIDGKYNGWRLEDAWLDKSTLTARAENGARQRTEGNGR